MSKILKLIFFSLLVSSCSSKSDDGIHNYHEIKDRIINWNQIFDVSEVCYLIYFYSERCGCCNDIKQDILNYYFYTRPLMYFVCTDYEIVTGPKKELLGVDNIKEFYIFGTPFMTVITDHSVSSYYAGKEEILGFISI